MKKLRTKKTEMLRRNGPVVIRGVSPEAGRESMVGKICERGSCQPSVSVRTLQTSVKDLQISLSVEYMLKGLLWQAV